MGLLYNNANSGTSGTQVSAANSGTSGAALDTGGTNYNVAYSNAVVLNGANSFLFTPTAGSQSSFIMFRNAGGTANSLTFTPTTGYSSVYTYFVTGIPTIGRYMEFVNSAFSHIGGVGVNASRKLTLVNAAGTTTNTSTTTLPIGAWFRVEMMVISSATVGQIIAKIFLTPNSNTPDETVTSAATLNTRGGAIAAVVWGYPTTTSTSNVAYMDDPVISDIGWIGPTIQDLATISGIASTAALGAPTVSPGAVNLSITGISSTATLGTPTVTAAGTPNYPATTTATATTFATSVTTMAVNMPASISAGDLLIAHVGVRNAGTWTLPSGWTVLNEQAGGGAVGETGVWYKIASGSEGSTQTWTAGTATTAAWQVRKITNWHGTTPPEYTSTNGDAVAVDPPSLTPSWGSADTLWLALSGSSANTMTYSAAPTNYTDLVSTTASSGGGASNAGSAVRQLTASSEDPGTFTTSTNRWWSTFNVAVRPAASGGSQNISATGIASTATIGSPTVSPGSVNISPASIATTLAIGTVAVTSVYNIAVSGIASTATLGTPTLSPGTVTASPTSIASSATLGTPTVTPGAVNISVTAISSTSSVGTPTVTSANTLSVTSISATSTLGSPTVSPGAVNISVTGISSTTTIGSPTVSLAGGATQNINVTSISSSTTIGTPGVTPGAVNISPTSIAATSSVGTVGVSSVYNISVTGIASTSTLGTPTASPGAVSISPASITSTLAFGIPSLTPGEVTILATGIASTATVGTPTVSPGAVNITPTGRASTVTFGNVGVAGGVPPVISEKIILLTDGRLAYRINNKLYIPL